MSLNLAGTTAVAINGTASVSSTTTLVTPAGPIKTTSEDKPSDGTPALNGVKERADEETAGPNQFSWT